MKSRREILIGSLANDAPGRVVGKEAEDLARHDKWLCMMHPRPSPLRVFLREDGVFLAKGAYC